MRIVLAALVVALGGCVAYPAGPGYYGGPAYYAPAPVVVAPVYGSFGYYHYGHR